MLTGPVGTSTTTEKLSTARATADNRLQAGPPPGRPACSLWSSTLGDLDCTWPKKSHPIVGIER